MGLEGPWNRVLRGPRRLPFKTNKKRHLLPAHFWRFEEERKKSFHGSRIAPKRSSPLPSLQSLDRIMPSSCSCSRIGSLLLIKPFVPAWAPFFFFFFGVLSVGFALKVAFLSVEEFGDGQFYRTRLLWANLLQPLKYIETVTVRLDCLASVFLFDLICY